MKDNMESIQKRLNKGTLHSLSPERTLLKAEDCTADDFAATVQEILKIGATKYDAWEESGSQFATLCEDSTAWFVSFHEKTGVLRVVAEPKGTLAPLSAPEITVEPLVTQVRLSYYAYDCGMLYVIRLGDGRFAVIDGGMAEFEEPEHFLELLREQNVRGGVPEIAVWFITHPHNDHFGLLVHLHQHCREQFVLRTVVYNWADAAFSAPGSCLTEFDRVIASLDGVNLIPEHTGQRFVYSGVTFRMLYTHEDSCPDYLHNVNDTSLVMRADFAGQRILWTGDAMVETANLLCEEYAPEVLRCDALQVAHHGYWGGSDELYRTVDPTVVLWPCPDFWFQPLHLAECNRYLTESPRVERLYLGGSGEVVWNLATGAFQWTPAPAQEGEFLLNEDFSSGQFYSTGWNAVTGGQTNYASATVEIEPGKCRMLATVDRYSVCELLRPEVLVGIDSFRVTLRGFATRVGESGETALFWNYSTPTVYSDEQALKLPLKSGEPFDVRLEADGKTMCANLYHNGEWVKTVCEEAESTRGVYLILKDADVTLTEVQIMR